MLPTHRENRTCVGILLTAVVVLSACDGSATNPSPAGRPGARTLAKVEIVGPTLIATGQTARYTAIARYSDGSSQDVTRAAHWAPTEGTAESLFVSQPGLARAIRPGESRIWATHHPTSDLPLPAEATGSLVVLVLDPGTFKLGGVITESDGGVLPGWLYGVTVEVVSGSGLGQHSTTDHNGEYRLFGIFGQAGVRVSAAGFTPVIQNVDVIAHGVTRNFVLTPVEPTGSVAGIWAMTVTPAPSCPPSLPESARDRPYELQLTQQGTRVRPQVSGPTVSVSYAELLGGTMLGSRLQLRFVGESTDEPVIHDRLGTAETFEFSGLVDATFSGRELRGNLNGQLAYWNREVPGSPRTWSCRANDHIVTLRR